jgi:hypothetical protein
MTKTSVTSEVGMAGLGFNGPRPKYLTYLGNYVPWYPGITIVTPAQVQSALTTGFIQMVYLISNRTVHVLSISTVAGSEDRATMPEGTVVLSGTELVSGHTIPPGISNGYTDQSRIFIRSLSLFETGPRAEATSETTLRVQWRAVN